MRLASGAFEGPYSFKTRFEDEKGTNPEELIGAAHAGCFSMALAARLEKAGHTARNIDTKAEVELKTGDGDIRISSIALTTEADVPDIKDDEFQKLAEDAKQNCPVSKALAGTEITLKAQVVHTASS
jgi:osmotically inducible protein OsmC